MKSVPALLLLAIVATPALASSSKSDHGVTFTCEVTGSDKDGFSLYAKNDGDVDRDCKATCTLTDGSGKKQSFTWPTSGKKATTAKAKGSRFQFYGDAGL
jgi:hypothetical protein